MAADWSDLRIFLTLAREGNLAAAARKLAVSHPTVARRIKALEQSIGAKLFDRLPTGFALTAAGDQLVADAESMERAAESIDRRSAGLSEAAQSTVGTVRLSAGEAMIGWIAGHQTRLRHGMQCVEFELAASHMLANLSRREADLMIREQVPDLGDIVTRRLGAVGYAVYGLAELKLASHAPEAVRRMPWISFDEAHAYMPGQRWLRDRLDGLRPRVRVNNWQVMHEAARGGAGLAVLPCYLGDADPALKRHGPVLDVTADQWLLVHRDLRALPRVRGVMDALVQLFQDERAALEGRRPSTRRAQAA